MATGHSNRRPRVPGGQPRKLYPYVTAAQRKGGIAEGMSRFITANQAELEARGNSLPSVQKTGRMSQKQAGGRLGSKWGNVIKRGASARKVKGYVDSKGGSASSARRDIVAAHDVHFGSDPKRK